MYQRFVKKTLDVISAFLLLLLSAHVFLVLCVTGAVFMNGSPFFIQTRTGKNEQPFRLIKFRSMRDSRDGNGNLLPDDRRTTRYGRFLRKTSLDELPQLFNILIGEMSFVGPRPLLPEYLPYYTEEERLRHTVTPGLTGLAQINGRTNIRRWEDRFACDLQYVRNCSFALDCAVIGRTVINVIQRKDALTGGEITAGRLDVVRSGGRHADFDQKIP